MESAVTDKTKRNQMAFLDEHGQSFSMDEQKAQKKAEVRGKVKGKGREGKQKK